jgi:hypothetical protein
MSESIAKISGHCYWDSEKAVAPEMLIRRYLTAGRGETGEKRERNLPFLGISVGQSASGKSCNRVADNLHKLL